MVITLIGMPGCGKSCMGRALAGKLKMKLVDSDRLIEKRYEKKLQVLIDELGVEAFRKIEEEVISSIQGENLIVSTGGSAVYSDKAMKHLKSLGKVIYLYCSLDIVKERLGDFSKRGVVLREGQTIADLYDERVPLYRQYADITILCDGNAFPQYQSAAIRAINRYRGGNAPYHKKHKHNGYSKHYNRNTKEEPKEDK